MSYIGASPTTAAFVTDTFSANGSGTVFTLSVAPANTNSILVAVSGVLQDPSTYSVAGTALTFSAAPPAGTGNISVRFLGIPASGVTNTAYRTQTEFTATAGQTTFSVPSYTVGFIDVYRNGALLGSADFTATSGTTVVLTNAASSGDLIETISFFVSSVINAIPATAGAVTSSYLLDGSVTQAKLATNVVGNGPAFSASITSNQTLTANTVTKLTFNSETFDTNNNYDPTTNFRFTPNVAGYYQINAAILLSDATSNSTGILVYLYKNGSQYAYLRTRSQTGDYTSATLAYVVSMNGSTDYLEVYAQSVGNNSIAYGSQGAYFSGALVRAA